MVQRSIPAASSLQFDQTKVTHRALIVDDSKLQRRILSATLKRWGFEVQQAETAEDALTLCATAIPDLIISDWMMPGMSGIEFCREFREISKDNFAYFILLTAKSDKAEVALGLDSGADDFLTKPVDTNELRARISAGTRIVDMQRELKEKNRLVNVTLEELQRVYDLLDRDLIEAKRFQQSLLPERDREFETGSLSLLLRSAGRVGGDLVGFFQTDDGKLGLFGIDVSGHGISSALITARLAGNLSGSARDQNVALARQSDGSYFGVEPAEVVSALNDIVLNEMETEHYLTLVLAFVDLATGHVTLTQAGHPHPLVQRKDGSFELIGSGGFPVGLLPNAQFDQVEFSLNPGDRLFLFSDGITECPDNEGSLLEDQGLERLLARLKDMKGPAVLEALIWELSGFAGTEDFPDDVSGILFEFSGETRC